MKRSLSLILGLSAALALGAFACGDDDDKDKNSDVECSSDADCAGNADSGKTKCDLVDKVCVAPLLPDVECSSDADCAGNADSGKTKCDLANQICVVPPNPGACTSDEDCDSGICEKSSGVCATAKMAPCTDPNIEHAVVNTEAMVQVTFEGGAWSAAAICPWLCESGYQMNDGKTGCEALPACTANDDCRSKLCDTETKTCATSKQDKCKAYTDAELAARYATEQDEEAMVTWTYIESSDGSAAWTAEGNCRLTACVEGYELDSNGAACVSTTEKCTKDSDCEGNAEKTYCYISQGASEGSCIVPECNATADCKDNADGKVYCQNHKCVAYCTYDEDCQAVHGDEKPMCDWVYGSDTAYTCIAPECEPNTCSEDKRSYCKGMRWEECASDKECATEGGEGITGTCQIIKSSGCNPACEEDQFCRDNGEAAGDDRYICEYLDAQLTTPTIRISQLYFGGYGTSTTATYTNGFIELYNYGTDEVDLSDMVLLKGSRAGAFSTWLDFSTACAEKNCKVAAGAYFRIKNNNNSVSTAEPVTSNLEVSDNLSQDGSIALATRLPESATCNEVKKVSVDLIGMGSAYCSETTPAAGIPGTDSGEGNRGTHSYQRSNGNLDTGNNYNDFTPKPVVLNN